MVTALFLKLIYRQPASITHFFLFWFNTKKHFSNNKKINNIWFKSPGFVIIEPLILTVLPVISADAHGHGGMIWEKTND